VLIDPDKQRVEDTVAFAVRADEAGIDAFLVGSSLLMSDQFARHCQQYDHYWFRRRLSICLRSQAF